MRIKNGESKVSECPLVQFFGPIIPQKAYFPRNSSAFKVLIIKDAMVIGPTPPGTGVMYEHFSETSSNLTSPRNFQPRVRVLSVTRVVPTSITTAPSFTISAVMNSGFPNAATKISAFLQISFKFLVLE